MSKPEQALPKPYYQDDSVTLYHGDCREITEWLVADVLVTDPPYGVGHRAGRHLSTTRKSGVRVRNTVARREASQAAAAAGKQRIAGDKSPADRDEMLDLWGDRPAIVFGSWRIPRPERVVQRLLWIKHGGGIHSTGMSQMSWVTGDEEIYVLGSTLAAFQGKPRLGYYVTTEIRQAEVGKIGHPTPKPIGLMEDLVSRCPEGVIADPFAGSGSTLLAARSLGRKVIGVELEERYCEIAANRLAQDAMFGAEA